MFVDISGCVAAVAYRNFYSEVEHSPQRLEGNELPVFVDISSCVAAVAHRNFIAKLSFSYFFSFFPPAFPPTFLSPKPLRRRVRLTDTSPVSYSASDRQCTAVRSLRKYIFV